MLSERVKIVPILTHASGTADRTSEVLDHKGFRKCLVVVHFGTIAAGAVTSMKLQHSDAASDENTLTSGVDVADSAQTIAADDDNEVKFLDFVSTKRFSQLVIDKDGANACAEAAVAYLYDPEIKPVTHAAGGTTIGEGTDEAAGERDPLATSGTA